MNRSIVITTASALALGLSTAMAGDNHYEPGSGGHLFVMADELEWGPVGSMGEGAEIAVIEGDLGEEKPFTFRLRLEDGYEIQPHVHPAYERGTILQGTLHFAHGEEFDRDQTKALPEGSTFIMAPGAPMYGYAEGEVIFQLHGEGPWGIEYIDEEHDPRQ